MTTQSNKPKRYKVKPAIKYVDGGDEVELSLPPNKPEENNLEKWFIKNIFNKSVAVDLREIVQPNPPEATMYLLELQEAINTLIKSQQLQLIEKIDKQVIGEDEESGFSSISIDGEEMLASFANDTEIIQNKLRATQRTALDKIRREI